MASATLLGVLMTTGCASANPGSDPGVDEGTSPTDSIAREVVRGTPDDIALTEEDLERGEPLAFWSEDRAALRVVTWGSSGCPPVAQSFAATTAGEAALDFAPNPAEFCTADFAPSTHVLDTPSDVDSAAELTLLVTIVDGTGGSESFRVPVQE